MPSRRNRARGHCPADEFELCVADGERGAARGRPSGPDDRDTRFPGADIHEAWAPRGVSPARASSTPVTTSLRFRTSTSDRGSYGSRTIDVPA